VTARALLIACLALLAAAAAAAPGVAAARTVPRGWLGVTADGPVTPPSPDLPGEWSRMAAAGVESVRTALYWDRAQPADPASGAPADFAEADAVVRSAARRGLAVLPVVQRPPSWAAARPGDPASPPREPAQLGRFLGVLVRRYGPAGTFWAAHPELPRMPIRAWQIFNEPNLALYWSVQPFAPTYVAALRAASAALRAADPGAAVVLGGLPNESWVALRRIYAEGARGLFDAVAIHPYTGTPSRVLEIARLVRREARRAGDPDVPLWLTELSWPSTLARPADPPRFETTEASQAARLETTVRRLARARRRLGIGRVYWYTWLSADRGSSVRFDYAGLRRRRGGRVVSVPALAAFRRVARRLEGCAKRGGDARRCRS